MTLSTKVSAIDQGELQGLLARKVTEVAREPDYSWGDSFRSFMTEDDGTPVVRLAVTNCAPDLDVWQGLRNPAQVGMYPIGLPDIWMHYAAANVKSTRYDGSPNPLAMPEPFAGRSSATVGRSSPVECWP